MPTSRLQDILDKLVNNEKTGHTDFQNYSLRTMPALLGRMGCPHLGINTVHIAGTNGKGSTAYMIAEMLILSGYKTGLYVSPHLESPSERISINGRPISEGLLESILLEIIEASSSEGLAPTYFDALTAAAFEYFKNKSVDIAIIETGLGGRLDSTNVIEPLVTVITDISLDHVPLLGKTVLEISTEKAGIVKTGVPIVTSNHSGDALVSIKKAAKEKASALYVLKKDFQIYPEIPEKTDVFSYMFNDIYLDNIRIKPPGAFQAVNASLAITSIFLLEKKGFHVGTDVIKEALGNLVIPGRIETLSQKPHIIFDPAHNPESLRSLVEYISSSYSGENIVYLVCFMKDKDTDKLFSILSSARPSAIVYYIIDDERVFAPDALPPDFEGVPLKIIGGEKRDERLRESLRQLCGGPATIVATGSFRIYPFAKMLALTGLC